MAPWVVLHAATSKFMERLVACVVAEPSQGLDKTVVDIFHCDLVAFKIILR